MALTGPEMGLEWLEMGYKRPSQNAIYLIPLYLNGFVSQN